MKPSWIAGVACTVLVAIIVACGSSPPVGDCNIDADCAHGKTCLNGACVPIVDAGSPRDAASD